MHAFTELPPSYTEAVRIDLQGNKRLAVAVNLAAGLVMAALLVLGNVLFLPVWTALEFGPDTTLLQALARPIVLLLGMTAYLVLHELTHGAAMKFFGAKKVRFGFTGLYAFAGSERDYFDKTAYMIITLAPLAVWGVFFTAMLIFVPRNWFWVVYFWQVSNISGSAGDMYVAWRTGRMTPDVLARDTGVAMTLYTKTR